jgi:preprotein translocase subunit SecA
MEEGQAIESRMVSRRITAAQKKVEERNFDSRKHLLEYDEVMDHQRKEVYGYRQRILDGTNCKVLVMKMFDRQVDLAVDRFLDADYGAESFSQFAATRLGVELDAADFARSTFDEASRTARDKAHRAVPTLVQEALEENLGGDDAREWNWQALAHQVNTRFGLKTTDRELKQIGQENLAQHLNDLGVQAIEAIDLSEGRPFLQPDWGLRSLCDWARLKYGITLELEELKGLQPQKIGENIRERIREMYHRKEVEFPVEAGMAQYMSDRPGGAPGASRYNREGLYGWASARFLSIPGRPVPNLLEEDFRTQSRQRLHEILLEASKLCYPEHAEEEIDGKIDEVFEGSGRGCDADDAAELAQWMQQTYAVTLDPASLTGRPEAEVRSALYNAFDARYRPEMTGMERSLVLHQLDSAWKNHLYQMDHLRAGIGLVGYAQEDPKTVYKQEGMKEFKAMWEGVEDRITEMVFRMEETEGFQESVWRIGAATHQAAPSLTQEMRAQATQEMGSTGNDQKKVDPIRNRGQKVGRNDPCPCGSGKKYKNCHMRQTV